MPKDSQLNQDKSSKSIKPVEAKMPNVFSVISELEGINQRLDALGNINIEILRELKRIRLCHRPFSRDDIVAWNVCDSWVQKMVEDKKTNEDAALLAQAKANMEAAKNGA